MSDGGYFYPEIAFQVESDTATHGEVREWLDEVFEAAFDLAASRGWNLGGAGLALPRGEEPNP